MLNNSIYRLDSLVPVHVRSGECQNGFLCYKDSCGEHYLALLTTLTQTLTLFCASGIDSSLVGGA